MAKNKVVFLIVLPVVLVVVIASVVFGEPLPRSADGIKIKHISLQKNQASKLHDLGSRILDGRLYGRELISRSKLELGDGADLLSPKSELLGLSGRYANIRSGLDLGIR